MTHRHSFLSCCNYNAFTARPGSLFFSYNTCTALQPAVFRAKTERRAGRMWAASWSGKRASHDLSVVFEKSTENSAIYGDADSNGSASEFGEMRFQRKSLDSARSSGHVSAANSATVEDGFFPHEGRKNSFCRSYSSNLDAVLALRQSAARNASAAPNGLSPLARSRSPGSRPSPRMGLQTGSFGGSFSRSMTKLVTHDEHGGITTSLPADSCNSQASVDGGVSSRSSSGAYANTLDQIRSIQHIISSDSSAVPRVSLGDSSSVGRTAEPAHRLVGHASLTPAGTHIEDAPGSPVASEATLQQANGGDC